MRQSVSLEELADLPADPRSVWDANSPEYEAGELLRQLRVEERELLTMRY